MIRCAAERRRRARARRAWRARRVDARATAGRASLRSPKSGEGVHGCARRLTPPRELAYGHGRTVLQGVRPARAAAAALAHPLQDVEMGSLGYMPVVKKLLIDEGATFTRM